MRYYGCLPRRGEFFEVADEIRMHVFFLGLKIFCSFCVWRVPRIIWNGSGWLMSFVYSLRNIFSSPDMHSLKYSWFSGYWLLKVNGLWGGGDLVIADCGVCAEISAFNDEIAKSLFQRNYFYLRKSIRYAERGWAVKKSSPSMCTMIPLSQCKWLWLCFFFSANLSGMCIYLMAGVGLVQFCFGGNCVFTANHLR